MAELENKIQFHFIEIDLYALQKRLVIVQQVSFFLKNDWKQNAELRKLHGKFQYWFLNISYI